MRLRLLLGLLVALLLVTAAPARARAAAGFDSSYYGESAFLTLAPGQTGQLAVGFTNMGSLGWQTGTATQVNLAICSTDKTTCNAASQYATWAAGWHSSTAYATQSTSYVGPGQTGWFVYTVRPPAGTPDGITARFNGDLVVAASGELIHPQGYYQDVTVGSAASAPTRLAVDRSYQTARIGGFPLVTATVTADPPAGSSTRPAVANVPVIFDVTTTATFNSDLSFTASTNPSGQASITYTRANPGTDTITMYVASAPTVRASATIVWTLTGSAIDVTPADAVARVNDATGCRAYSFTARDASGALVNTATLYVNFMENINRTADQDGGATITVGTTTVSPSPSSSLAVTTNASGAGSFTVCGNGSTATVTPFVFDNAGGGDPATFGTNDNAGTGGPITFQARVPSLTISPVSAVSRVVGDQAVYMVTATDQFGIAYTGPIRISFQELQDGNPSTTTGAMLAWVDNDASLAVTGVSGSGPAPGTTDIPDVQTYALSSLNSAGQASFAVYAVNPQVGTPMVWVDTNGNGVFDAGEPSAVGGTTTWSAATLSQCTLTRSKPLLPVSVGSPNAGSLSDGDVFMVVTFRDQSGTALSLPSSQVLTFQVTNTGGGTIAARAEGQTADTLISAGGGAAQPTGYAIGDSDAYLVLDASTATSASVSMTTTVGGRTISCGPTSVKWENALPEPTSGTLSGTVIDVDRGASTSDGGGYVLRTTAGDYVITYTPGQPLIVTGAAVTEAQFEAALSVGDVILWSYNGGAESHNITTNN